MRDASLRWPVKQRQNHDGAHLGGGDHIALPPSSPRLPLPNTSERPAGAAAGAGTRAPHFGMDESSARVEMAGSARSFLR